MSKNPLRPLSEEILRPGSAINDLARRTEAMSELTAGLRAGLPPELAGSLRSAHVSDDGTLVVLASSSAWAARLRFEGPTLLVRCRASHPQVTRIKVRSSGET
jgi:hypothetical protein